MKVIVGLGNPGEEYARTRHNVGFMVLDRFFERITNVKYQMSNEIQNSNFKFNHKFNAEVIQVGELMLMKPQTFMNRSGEAVQKIMQFYKVGVSDLWVIHDDLDIKLGEYKIQMGKGPKVHNGVNSVEKTLGTSEFWRVRIGIDGRNQLPVTSNQKISGEEYVLGRFTGDEKEILEQTLGKVTNELISKYL